MSKYYAVLQGRETGIYRSWPECQAQVSGYRGARYKSFTTEAEAQAYLTPSSLILPSPSSLTPSPSLTSLRIYTDGSHKKSLANTNSPVIEGHLGCGAWCRWKNREYSFSRPLTTNLLASYDITEKVSNPTAEFVAFAEVLKYFYERRDTIPPTLQITFCIDYVGVAAWMNNTQQARKPYIIAVKNRCHEYLAAIPAKVTIEYVASKSDEGNRHADRLAKSEEATDNFAELFAAL